MCIETHTRYLRCTHTRFLRWDYCSILIPTDRLPSTGRACQRYKLRHKDTHSNYACFECLRTRAIAEATGAVFTERGVLGGSPTVGMFVRSEALSILKESTVYGGKSESKGSEDSLAQSDGPQSPGAKGWREEMGDEGEGGQGVETVKKKGIKGWFKEIFASNEMGKKEVEAMVFQFQRMDA